MKLVVAISGASGAPYAKRLLDFLAANAPALDVHVDLVFTETARQIWSWMRTRSFSAMMERKRLTNQATGLPLIPILCAHFIGRFFGP